ncbi:MAG: hypothetical protein PHT96_13805 [Syntrophorhabdaceae bacterium]|jgi:hypothetical protein|nr:hypothetical protein [Syntrophorhabdaceae bacterium]MDD4197459.1 hypothetical protein [Syntrophorhabdaceae bacterium]HOC46653.1 hypothetical protein [Syntrophorhabdaceae bacterium]
MTTDEQKMVLQYADQAFRGKTIRQEYPVCECGKIFNEKNLFDAPGVFFKNIDVFGKTFMLIEPVCPVCKRKVPASFNILN